MLWRTLAVISAGGVLGALARYGLTAAFPVARGGFDWAVFGINVAGCFLIGLVVVLITESRRANHLLRLPARSGLMALAGTGFCGALTTYSTFGYETVQLVRSGARTVALLNLGASVLAGFGAAYGGMAMARALAG